MRRLRVVGLIALAVVAAIVIAYHVTNQRSDTTCIKIADSIAIAGKCE